MIRRGDLTDIVWVFAHWMKCLISNQHFTAFLIWLRHITTKCLGKPQNFWVYSSRRLGIIRVAIWEVQFLSDPCVFGCIS